MNFENKFYSKNWDQTLSLKGPKKKNPDISIWDFYFLNLITFADTPKFQEENLERETGLKPATYALARHRSINWATPASGERRNYCCLPPMSTGKNKKMNTILLGRLKKWIILAFIGCAAYFAGYIMGQNNHPTAQKVDQSEIKSQ